MAALGLLLVLLGAAFVWILPGLVAADALAGETRAARWLSAPWLGATLVGCWAMALAPAPAVPWLAPVGFAAVVIWIGRAALKAELRAGWDAAGPPIPLLVIVALYGWLRPDSLAFNTLGVLGPAVEALGHPLGLGGELPERLLGRSLPAPLGQIAPAVVALEVFGQPGVRLWFALVLVMLCGATFLLCREVGVSRRGATIAAAFAVWNPLTMDANHLDSLTNLLPAAVLGFVLLARPRHMQPVWTATLLLARPLYLLSLPLLGRREPLRWLPFGLAILGLGALPLLGGDAFQLDPGLLPLTGVPDAWAWTTPWTRLPYAAAPSWALLPLWTLSGLGSLACALAVVGARALWTEHPGLARRAAALMGPVAVFLLATNLVFQAEQAGRLTLFLVPGVAAAARGLAAVRADRRTLALAVALMVGLPALGRALVLVPWPVQTAAYDAFPHLAPEPSAWLAQERRRAAPLRILPRYSVEHLIDPLFIGEGKRWRDAAAELVEPSQEHRYYSIDETILRFTRGERFTHSWLPDHPRLRPRGQEKGAGDPYLEEQPLVVGVDLATALSDGRLRAECRRDDALAVHLDLAAADGPLAATVRVGGTDVALAAFKEYYGPTEVETALVLNPPAWSTSPDPAPLDLPDGVLRVRVPGRAFLSYAQVLGERHDTLELLVAQVFHAALRCEDGVEVYGPFRQ